MSDTDRLRTGVIGAGSMGKHHARVYRELPEAELVGVSDADSERAAEIAKTYSTDVFEVDDLIQRVDAVTVAVPTAFHYELGRKCIDAGIGTLVEKPIVADPRRGRDLVAAAETADATLQVGHIERYNPVVETLQEIVPDLDVITVEAKRAGPQPERQIRDTAVLDLMIHDIDVVQALVDADVESVDATGTADGRHATATIQFDDGVIGSLTANRITEKKVRELEITARDCYLTVDYMDQSIAIHRRSDPHFEPDDGDDRYRQESVVEYPAVETGEPLKRELQSFLEACKIDTDPKVTGYDGLRALELAREINARAFDDSRTTVDAIG